jgi:surface protein
MSVRFLNNNASGNTDVAAKTFPSVAPWVRNPSWPACEANSGDNRVRGLYAVWPDGGNFIAMSAVAAYTVDFGDGTTTNFASGTQANYEYSYSAAALVGTEAPVTFTDTGDLVTRTAHGYTNGMQVQFFNITTTTGIVNAQFYFVINATANTFQVSATSGGAALALTNDGTGQLLPYRIATVTITPQGGNNLTTINFLAKHNQAGLTDGYVASWLDLAYAASTITTLTMGTSGGTIRFNYLERVRLNQLGSITSFASLFESLRELQNVEIANTITTVTSTASMFANCSSLQTVPLFNTAAATNTSLMFLGCTSLQSVPLFNLSSSTNLSNMFNACSTLQTVPLFNIRTSGTVNMSSMFANCSGLQAVPLFNTVAVTNMNSMFQNAYNFQTVPLFNTAAVTGMNSMFLGCANLRTVPLFNTAAVTNMSSMFQGCTSLQTVPLFNTASATNLSNMFLSATSIQTVPLFNTAAATNTSLMFLGCTNLQIIPLFNTAAVTNMGNMFNGCSSLAAVPALVTTAVTSSANFGSMFTNCNSLARIEAKNFRFTFSVASCKLSATALNEIYTNLPTVTSQTITVTGNYGTSTDDPTIATAKGWTVTG